MNYSNEKRVISKALDEANEKIDNVFNKMCDEYFLKPFDERDKILYEKAKYLLKVQESIRKIVEEIEDKL